MAKNYLVRQEEARAEKERVGEDNRIRLKEARLPEEAARRQATFSRSDRQNRVNSETNIMAERKARFEADKKAKIQAAKTKATESRWINKTKLHKEQVNNVMRQEEARLESQGKCSRSSQHH